MKCKLEMEIENDDEKKLPRISYTGTNKGMIMMIATLIAKLIEFAPKDIEIIDNIVKKAKQNVKKKGK